MLDHIFTPCTSCRYPVCTKLLIAPRVAAAAGGCADPSHCAGADIQRYAMFATRSAVVAAFDDPTDALAAMNELRREDYYEGDIGCMGRNAGPGCDIPLVLTAWGLSDEEAAEYEKQYVDGRTVVIVDAGERPSEAHAIMHRHHPRDDTFAGIGIFGHDLPATPY